MFIFKRFISTQKPSSEISRIAEILAKSDEILVKKNILAVHNSNNVKQKTIDYGPIIMKELAKLTPVPLKWKSTKKDYSSIANFLTLADISLESSVYDYNKLIEKEKANNVKELPEIIFLGRCNVGKSSLINTLLSKKKKKEIECYARVKQHAGYTPCLNFYNIGGRFRLVDTPGYGVKGREWQGKLIFEYLQERLNLRNTYLILDAEIGLNQYDELIIENLTQLGLKFDIIFNKIDKIPESKRVERVLEIVNTGVIGELNMKPRCYAVSCNENNRTGISEVMVSALESCGLIVDGNTSGLTAIKKKHTLRSEVVRQRYKQGKKEHKEQQRKDKEEREKRKLAIK